MSKIEIRKIGITKLAVDAIVNAANEGLWEGGGVCGAIFSEAGSAELTKACQKYGHCDTGKAVITPGFNLPAKKIIHAVGPRWIDGNHNEPSLLYDAYKSSLELARENGCHSIAFPLISAGIFGYSKKGSWKKGFQASKNFINKYPDYDITIIFAVLDDNTLSLGEEILAGLEPSENVIPEPKEFVLSQELDEKVTAFINRNINLLSAIYHDEGLNRWFSSDYTPKEGGENHSYIAALLTNEFVEKAYELDVIIPEYWQIIDKYQLDQEKIQNPTEEWANSLPKEALLACVAYHFRADHFDNGCLERVSVAKGKLLPILNAYLRK